MRRQRRHFDRLGRDDDARVLGVGQEAPLACVRGGFKGESIHRAPRHQHAPGRSGSSTASPTKAPSSDTATVPARGARAVCTAEIILCLPASPPAPMSRMWGSELRRMTTALHEPAPVKCTATLADERAVE